MSETDHTNRQAAIETVIAELRRRGVSRDRIRQLIARVRSASARASPAVLPIIFAYAGALCLRLGFGHIWMWRARHRLQTAGLESVAFEIFPFELSSLW